MTFHHIVGNPCDQDFHTPSMRRTHGRGGRRHREAELAKRAVIPRRRHSALKERLDVLHSPRGKKWRQRAAAWREARRLAVRQRVALAKARRDIRDPGPVGDGYAGRHTGVLRRHLNRGSYVLKV